MSDNDSPALPDNESIKDEETAPVEEAATPTTKKGRGRPKGSTKDTPAKKYIKKEKKKTPKAEKVKTHPNFAEMIIAAVTASDNKKGTTLASIKSYIYDNYDGVEEKKVATFCKKNLMRLVADKSIKQTKGTNALGRFKIGDKKEDKESKTKSGKKGKIVKPRSYAKCVKHDSDTDEEDLSDDPDFKATYYGRVVMGRDRDA